MREREKLTTASKTQFPIGKKSVPTIQYPLKFPKKKKIQLAIKNKQTKRKTKLLIV